MAGSPVSRQATKPGSDDIPKGPDDIEVAGIKTGMGVGTMHGTFMEITRPDAQRRRHAVGYLRADRAERLLAVAGWSRSQANPDRWAAWFAVLAGHVQVSGDARVPTSLETGDGVQLGVWVGHSAAQVRGRSDAGGPGCPVGRFAWLGVGSEIGGRARPAA